jgi:NodT family efflux transporter outer membrane factor (OMF) lipoprotein
MRRRAHRAALAGLLLVASCDLAPTYHPPLVATPVAYKSVGPWQPATPSDTLPRGPWWRVYRDPTLDRLEPQVEAANPDLAAAVANYDAARAFAAEVNASLFPFVTLGGDASRNRQSARRPLRSPNQPNYYGANTIDGEVNWEVDLWDRIRNEIRAGNLTAQAAAADLASVQLSLQAELADDYMVLRGFDAEIKLLADTTTAYGKGVTITNNRYLGKIASGLDVARAQTELAAARAIETETIAQRALMEHAIASLVGRPASTFTIPQSVTALRVPRVPTGMPAALLQRRPDIAAAERRVAVQNALIGVARAAFFPDISLNLIAGFQNTGGASLISLPLAFWSVGPQLVMPLFEGGLRRAAEARAYADWRLASDDYRAIVLTAFQQVEDDLSLLNNLGLESRQEAEAVAAANRTLALSNALYQDGAVNYLEVVVAEAQDLDAQRTALGLETRRLEASVQLIRALGGGWTTRQLPTVDEVQLIQ